MNQKGKILTESYIVKPVGLVEGKIGFKKDQLWLEVPESQSEELMKHLKKFSFRKKVGIYDIEDEVSTFCLFHLPTAGETQHI